MIRIPSINKFLVAIVFLPFFLAAGPETGPSQEKKACKKDTEAAMQEAYNSLKDPEKKVYDALGATYKKIYLFALNNEERWRVVSLVKKGLDPHAAINSILRSDYRKQMRQQKKQKALSPAARSIIVPPKYTIY